MDVSSVEGSVGDIQLPNSKRDVQITECECN